MNALRVLIAVLWLAMSSIGASAVVMPAVGEAHPMSCHQESDTAPASDDLSHKAMPCCAHMLNIPAPVPSPVLVAAPFSHRIEAPLTLQGFVLSLDPDPPRSV